jgi:uncharacterized membrane protein
MSVFKANAWVRVGVALIAVALVLVVITIIAREVGLEAARKNAAAQVAALNTGTDLFVEGNRIVRVTLSAPAAFQVGQPLFVHLSAQTLPGASSTGFDDLGSGFLSADLKAPGLAPVLESDVSQPTSADQMSWTWELTPDDIGQSLESHEYITASIYFSPTSPTSASLGRQVYLNVVAAEVSKPWYAQLSTIVVLVTGVFGVLGLVVGWISRLRVKSSPAS